MQFGNFYVAKIYLENLQLELIEPPLHRCLAVFVRDPKKPNQYWFRRVDVEASNLRVREENTRKGLGRLLKYFPPFRKKSTKELDNTGYLEQNSVGVGIFNMGSYSTTIITEDELPDIIRTVYDAEKTLGRHPNPNVKNFQATVGVASYIGKEQLPIDMIASLAGLKYHDMRAARFN